MKIALNVLGVLLGLPGLTFFLQGINVLPGSGMTGDPKWAVIGGLMVVVAAVLFWYANRRTDDTGDGS